MPLLKPFDCRGRSFPNNLPFAGPEQVFLLISSFFRYLNSILLVLLLSIFCFCWFLMSWRTAEQPFHLPMDSWRLKIKRVFLPARWLQQKENRRPLMPSKMPQMSSTNLPRPFSSATCRLWPPFPLRRTPLSYSHCLLMSLGICLTNKQQWFLAAV